MLPSALHCPKSTKGKVTSVPGPLPGALPNYNGIFMNLKKNPLVVDTQQLYLPNQPRTSPTNPTLFFHQKGEEVVPFNIVLIPFQVRTIPIALPFPIPPPWDTLAPIP